MFPEHAENAIQQADGSSFQGRVIHIIKAKRIKENDNQINEQKKKTMLSVYQQKREDERKKMANKKDGILKIPILLRKKCY